MKYFRFHNGDRTGSNRVQLNETFWTRLKKKKITGICFLKTLPAYYNAYNDEHFFYIPDYYFPDIEVAIEIDSKLKNFEVDRDEPVDDQLGSLDMNVLRIENGDFEDIDILSNKVEIFLTAISN